jgi:hypothetical protein
MAPLVGGKHSAADHGTLVRLRAGTGAGISPDLGNVLPRAMSERPLASRLMTSYAHPGRRVARKRSGAETSTPAAGRSFHDGQRLGERSAGDLSASHGGYVYSKPTGSAHLLGLEHTWRAPTRVDGPLTTAEQPGSCRAPRRDENVAAASGAGRAAGRESPRPDSRPCARSRRNDWHARESHRSVRDPQSCSPSNVAWAASAGRRSAR